MQDLEVRLLSALEASGVLSAADLAAAGSPEGQPGPPIHRRLVALGLASERDVAKGLAGVLDYPLVDPTDQFAVDMIGLAVNKPVKVEVAVPSELQDALQRLYFGGKSAIEEIVEGFRREESQRQKTAHIRSGHTICPCDVVQRCRYARASLMGSCWCRKNRSPTPQE